MANSTEGTVNVTLETKNDTGQIAPEPGLPVMTSTPSPTGLQADPGGPSIPARDADANGLIAAPGATPLAAIQAMARTASVNPALVEFPADPWGMCTQLRKSGLLACSSVRGNAEKHLILMGTLMVLQGHAKNRLALDKAAADQEILDTMQRLETAEQYSRQHAVPHDPADEVRSALATIAAAKQSGLFPELVGG